MTKILDMLFRVLWVAALVLCAMYVTVRLQAWSEQRRPVHLHRTADLQDAVEKAPSR